MALELKERQHAERFEFFLWTAKRTVLSFSFGEMASLNVTFLVPDEDLTCERLLISLTFLRHFRIDSKTQL